MKLKYVFAILFGAPIIIINLIATYIFYTEAKERLLANQKEHLISITETKRNRVRDLLDQKRRLMLFLSNNYRIVSEVSEDPLEELLYEANELTPSVEELALVDSAGKVVNTTNRDFTKNFKPQPHFRQGVDSMLFVGDHFYTRKGRRFHVLSVPLPGSPVILFAFQNLNNINAYTSTYTGLGETGETVLVNQEGDLISKTRFGKETEGIAKEVVRQVNISDHELVNLTGRDYRNEPVYVIGTRIDDTNLYLYTKMDMKEVSNPIGLLRNRLMIIDILVSLVAIITGITLGNYLSKRLSKIIFSLRKIKEGEWSFRSTVESKTELGEVEATLNEVASEIEKTVSLLQSSNQALNKYAYIVAHDIKGPAQNMFALSQILKNEYENKLDEEGKRILEMLTEKSQSLQELVTQILDSAKKGFAEEDRRVVDVEKLLIKVLSNIKIPKNIKIEVDSPLPKVFYNQLLLYQVFMNLISNAVKYNDKKEGLVFITAQKQEKSVVFSIRDNGTGIPRHLHNKIFEMFGKAHSDAEKESYGIGLATVKRIITGNDGTIWLDSEPGKGTTFYFTVPAAKDHIR